MHNDTLDRLVLRTKELIVLGVSECRLAVRLHDQGSVIDITAVPVRDSDVKRVVL